MYSLISCLWKTPEVPEPIIATEPLRIRIPRFIICLNCEKEKILKTHEVTPKSWRCTQCYKKYACTFY